MKRSRVCGAPSNREIHRGLGICGMGQTNRMTQLMDHHTLEIRTLRFAAVRPRKIDAVQSNVHFDPTSRAAFSNGVGSCSVSATRPNILDERDTIYAVGGNRPVLR